MTREALRGLVRPALYSPTLGALLPYAIDEAAAGRYDPLMALRRRRRRPSPEGEHFSVVCAEDVPRMRPAAGRGRRPGRARPVPRRLRALAARRRADRVLHDPAQRGAGAAAVRRRSTR